MLSRFARDGSAIFGEDKGLKKGSSKVLKLTLKAYWPIVKVFGYTDHLQLFMAAFQIYFDEANKAVVCKWASAQAKVYRGDMEDEPGYIKGELDRLLRQSINLAYFSQEMQ